MEEKGIVIRIPPWVVDKWEYSMDRAQLVSDLLTGYIESIWLNIITNQRNSFFVIVSMILFWPFYAYCFVAVTTASTWIFWLLASVVLGIIQMIFSAYQFFIISCDIFLLTTLKTYQIIMRSRVAQFVFFFSKRIRTSRQKLSRRREWRYQCESVTEWSEYLKLKVWEKSPSTSVAEAMAVSSEEDCPSNRDDITQQPTLKRSTSFAAMKTWKESSDEEEMLQSPVRSLLTSGSGSEDLSMPIFKQRHRRSASLTRLQDLQDEAEVTRHTKDFADIVQDLGDSTAELLITTTEKIKEERKKLRVGHDSALEFLLSGVVKRDHLSLESTLESNARDVEVSGQYGFSAATRIAINRYYDEISEGLELLTEEDNTPANATATNKDRTMIELRNRITLFRKMKQNMGRTALMLSGGGAQAMYHLGTMRALIQSNLYQKIKVISGTSGGSIAAACCAMFTPEELLRDVCVPTVATDYLLNGEMKRRNIRWFPLVQDMVSYWYQHRLLVDSEGFYTTCEFYWGTTTFAEAFEKTGKHVCITVSASRARSGSAQRLLLNHISTPHVTLASAVSASCALPGVMKPAKLKTKNSVGQIEDFEVDGVDWIDGSVQADLPFQRISTLFNVSNFVVCQTNFHVLPFLSKERISKSAYQKIFQYFEWDIRSRALKLSSLGLFPRFFGQDISKVFKQKYHGNLTLIPRFTTMQTFGLHALMNPDLKQMVHYLKFGQLAAWPHLRTIRYMLLLETSLDEGLERLRSRVNELGPDYDELDDLDSITSNSTCMNAIATRSTRIVRFGNTSREAEVMKNKLMEVEKENRMLRQELSELRIRIEQITGSNDSSSSSIELTEGNVFNLACKVKQI